MNISIYIFALIFISYCLLRRDDFSKTNKKKLIIIGCFLLGLESGLRHLAVGPDTPTYYNTFNMISNGSLHDAIMRFFVDRSEQRDPMFVVIVKLFSMVVPSWQMFLVFLSIFYFFALGRLFYRYIDSLTGVLLAFCIYIALFDIVALSGIRQQITTAISMLVFPAIIDKKWRIVIPVLLLGATIHISELFVFGLIPLAYFKGKNQRILLIVSIILIPLIMVYAREIVEKMASLLTNDYYLSYAKSEQNVVPFTYILFCSGISLFIAIKTNILVKYNAPSTLLSACILMTLSVPLIALDGSMIRIGQYFTIYIMITLPFIFDRLRNRSMYYFISCVCLLYYIIMNGRDYYFFWQSPPNFFY